MLSLPKNIQICMPTCILFVFNTKYTKHETKQQNFVVQTVLCARCWSTWMPSKMSVGATGFRCVCVCECVCVCVWATSKMRRKTVLYNDRIVIIESYSNIIIWWCILPSFRINIGTIHIVINIVSLNNNLQNAFTLFLSHSCSHLLPLPSHTTTVNGICSAWSHILCHYKIPIDNL